MENKIAKYLGYTLTYLKKTLEFVNCIFNHQITSVYADYTHSDSYTAVRVCTKKSL